MKAVQQGQGLVHDIGTDLAGDVSSDSWVVGQKAARACSLTEHVNSFSSTRLPLLVVPSAMLACASDSGLRSGRRVVLHGRAEGAVRVCVCD